MKKSDSGYNPPGGCISFVFLGGIGGLLLYLGIKGISRHMELKKKCTERTSATVVDKADYSDLGEDIYNKDVSLHTRVIRYSINGEIYEQPVSSLTNGIKTYGVFERYHEGANLEILYDPHDPKSILPADNSFLKYNIILTGIGGILILLAFFVLKLSFTK